MSQHRTFAVSLTSEDLASGIASALMGAGSSDSQKPTEVTSFIVPWIYAENPTRQKSGDAEIDEETKEQITTMMFKELTESGKQITADDIKVIAKQTGDLSGKWLIYRSAQMVDATWEKISLATKDNKLGTACKVSTAGQAMLKPGGNHVICVYTDDYTNEQDVKRVEAGLREIGIGGTFSYKPDIYTTLDIYQGNQWKIKPTVYTSRAGASN